MPKAQDADDEDDSDESDDDDDGDSVCTIGKLENKVKLNLQM